MVATSPDAVRSPSEPVRDRELERARTFARVLDRYGLDPLLGLFLPAVGDLVGSLLGLYLVAIGVKRKLSKVVIARMMLNLGIDAALGAVPLLGDVFDFTWHANDKNLALLEQRTTRERANAGDWAVLLGAVAAFAGVIALVVYVVYRVARYLG